MQGLLLVYAMTTSAQWHETLEYGSLWEEIRNKKNIENKKKIDAEGKFDARWDDKLKFFFKVPKTKTQNSWMSSQIYESNITRKITLCNLGTHCLCTPLTRGIECSFHSWLLVLILVSCKRENLCCRNPADNLWYQSKQSNSIANRYLRV